MKHVATLVIISALISGGCFDRNGLDAQLKKLKIGMSKQQVEIVAGPPAHVLTHTNYDGTWTIGTEEMWQYAGPGTASGDGAVYFDARGTVQYVYSQGRKIAPPE